MEKQITIQVREGLLKRVQDYARAITHTLEAPIRLLRDYYSWALGRKVSLRQARALTETQLAFLLLVLPADCPLALRAAACGWFMLCLKKCSERLSGDFPDE